MSQNSQSEPKSRFSVLLESDSGVMEIFLVNIPVEDGVMFRSLGSIAQSGKLKSTNPQQLSDAVVLAKWANENQSVFEGQTSPQIESTN
ncbi:MAG: hypothetical protein ABJZ55_17125 [Fuerstiella sp.]